MRKQIGMGACVVDVGALTQAMRAQTVLQEVGLSVQVIKADQTDGQGCLYALRYSCAQDRAVREALRKAGVRVRG